MIGSIMSRHANKPSRHWLRWLIGALIVVAVLAVAGPFGYIHFVDGSTPTARLVFARS